ncbi:hypothetical protein SLA2020_404420 [Shorea laevis]
MRPVSLCLIGLCVLYSICCFWLVFVSNTELLLASLSTGSIGDLPWSPCLRFVGCMAVRAQPSAPGRIRSTCESYSPLDRAPSPRRSAPPPPSPCVVVWFSTKGLGLTPHLRHCLD